MIRKLILNKLSFDSYFECLLKTFQFRQKFSSRLELKKKKEKKKEHAHIKSMQMVAINYSRGLELLKIIGAGSWRSLKWLSGIFHRQNTFLTRSGRPSFCNALNKSALPSYQLKGLTWTNPGLKKGTVEFQHCWLGCQKEICWKAIAI